MKTIKVICFLILCFNCQAQSKIKIDSAGNYYQEKGSTATATGNTYTDLKGKVYPVYISVHGKKFIYRIAKSGNTYPFYLDKKSKE